MKVEGLVFLGVRSLGNLGRLGDTSTRDVHLSRQLCVENVLAEKLAGFFHWLEAEDSKPELSERQSKLAQVGTDVHDCIIPPQCRFKFGYKTRELEVEVNFREARARAAQNSSGLPLDVGLQNKVVDPGTDCAMINDFRLCHDQRLLDGRDLRGNSRERSVGLVQRTPSGVRRRSARKHGKVREKNNQPENHKQKKLCV